MVHAAHTERSSGDPRTLSHRDLRDMRRGQPSYGVSFDNTTITKKTRTTNKEERHFSRISNTTTTTTPQRSRMSRSHLTCTDPRANNNGTKKQANPPMCGDDDLVAPTRNAVTRQGALVRRRRRRQRRARTLSIRAQFVEPLACIAWLFRRRTPVTSVVVSSDSTDKTRDATRIKTQQLLFSRHT